MTDIGLCPDDELLIAYADGDMSAAELDHIDAHLSRCDGCLETLRGVHARLRATAGPLGSPPADVWARAQAAWLTQPAATTRRRVPVLLRLPILIPLSMAAGALLVVATHTWVEQPQPRVLNRAVQIQRTTHTVTVHTQPSGEAPVVTSLNAGEMVEVHTTQSGWYQITLPNGSEGWIEARAFE
jgi:anti-sigma factor RsiW